MALTGQLSDMSLAELIEFFCNQRKTGRLKIDYPRGHSVFFIKDGELVDAKVGALTGAEAVYFSLTLPNAAFDFSPEVMPQRRTINQSWTQVVLEGLRRLDEGQSPTEADAFGGFSPTESDMAQMLDHVERLGEQKARRERAAAPAPEPAEEPAPFSMMVESANGGGRKKWVLMAVAAAVVAACVLVAVPLMRGGAVKAPAKPEVSTPAPAPPESRPAPEAPAAESSQAEEPAAEAGADAAAAAAARREERERRERRERERRAEEAAARKDAEGETPLAKPAPSGPKSVRVTVTYDEAGRVTQASVAGATPGAEAYGSTAVRVARGRRFPAGKPGSAVVTIPVN
ncbi:MAG TPA: TonB family protein [Pyrinomonadaceae bacterium]|nr:TonB family protein [Pyrinomonadaceae bacterium]